MLIRVSLVLPYLLRLPNGNYLTGNEGNSLDLLEKYVSEPNGSGTKRTTASSVFDASASAELEQQLAIKNSQADALLRRTNRLIRWYRSETRQAAVVEVTRVQASPFVFMEKETHSLWGDGLTFEADPPAIPVTRSVASIARSVRSGMAGNKDPEVASLFLLDAEQALRDGRFREAVLFCWSTIDSTFSQKYSALVVGSIDNKDDREAFVNFRNASMRYRMSAGLSFFTGLSLYDQPNDLWTNLTSSYGKRNKIIHEGASAQEADAELALQVAREVVRLMASLNPQKPYRKKRNTS